jgi:hypothetical protein
LPTPRAQVEPRPKNVLTDIGLASFVDTAATRPSGNLARRGERYGGSNASERHGARYERHQSRHDAKDNAQRRAAFQ